VDVSALIRRRLDELGLEQRDLAAAAKVTESYISQLLTRKKSPPAPEKTDIYERIGKLLKLPAGKLSRLADSQRKEELKRTLGDPPAPPIQRDSRVDLGEMPAEATGRSRRNL
jgi:transcriptional regulator with XRE-family HTH domain